MRKRLYRQWFCVAVLMLFAPGCVELTGQRMTWWYDAATDEIKVLLFYDGVHDSPEGRNAPEVLRNFVRDGDFMLLDWFCCTRMGDLRKKLDDPKVKPLEKEAIKLVLSLKVEPVGYYREPDGRMGAAQLITVPHAKAFVAQVNALWNRSTLEPRATAEPAGPTEKLVRRAASAGHTWLALDGNAVRLTLPVHPQDLVRAKFDLLKSFSDLADKALGPDATPQVKQGFLGLLQGLSTVPFSYVEGTDQVQLTFGHRDAPTTLRVRLREEYEPNLEKLLADEVKVDLDKALAGAILDKTPLTPAQQAVLDRGPAEVAVAALLRAAAAGDAKRKEAAVAELRVRTKRWNDEQTRPPAPPESDAVDPYLDACKKWYGQLKRFPLPEETRPPGKKPS